MNKIWFTSDNHFGHKNIHKFCPETRPDVDVAIMNRNMIRRWQEQVRPEDTVYALGDFFFCNATEAKGIMRQLTGNIKLVYGNHDKTIRNDAELQRMFATIQEYAEIVVNGQTFCMFHYPIEEWNKMHHGAIHVYGHIHNKVMKSGGRAINVCIDSPDMYNGVPYSLHSVEDVIRVAEQREVRRHHEKVVL